MSNKPLSVSSLTTTYPATDLETAYKRLLKVGESVIGGDKVERAVIRNALGFGSDNGRSNSIISSLMHFGLLYRDEKEYFTTDLARKLIAAEEDKDEWSELALQAATSPKLFGQLYSRFKTTLPDDIKTKLMMGYRIKSERVDGVIKSYQKSLEFVGAALLLDQASDDSLGTPSIPLVGIDAGSRLPTPREELIAFPFPLDDRTLITLNLPSRISSSDAQRISRFLETLVMPGGYDNGQK